MGTLQIKSRRDGIEVGIETYVTSERRVEVRDSDEFREVEEVTVFLPVSTEPQETYPDTLTGALAALRA
jgi:hypothetical protein